MDISVATPAELINELVSRNGAIAPLMITGLATRAEFLGAVVNYTSFDATKRWNPLTITASPSLARRHLIDVLERAKDQTERGA
ncbi:hypothetical protein [Anatilimnocola floriformis]|uniref:hypothetical protein n=1 Tax=Anatilimnocola floriformis TaxID=2948575 RepID=UPI0020C4EA90|nr:hypothetical protein [Anatilimnocola floriformis]